MNDLFVAVDFCILVFIAASAFFYLNRTKSPLLHPRCWGMALVSGAAAGRALIFIWPGDNAWLLPWLIVGLHGGMAIFFGTMAIGKIYELAGVDRRHNVLPPEAPRMYERRFRRTV